MSAAASIVCDRPACTHSAPIPALSVLTHVKPIPRGGWLRTWAVKDPDEWFEGEQLLDLCSTDCLLALTAEVAAARAAAELEQVSS